MKANKETYRAAVDFAIQNGFDIVRYSTEYKNCTTYYVTSKALEGTCSGYPHYVLVDNELNCRYSTPAEAMEILGKEK